MTRKDFRKLAFIRLKEARLLLRNAKWDGAYYLSGYSIECALKACIANQTKEDDFPPKRNVIEAIYNHNPQNLIKAAGLLSKLNASMENDKILATYWNIVIQWNEESRYTIKSEREAKDLYEAIANKKHGVLSWLKQYW